MISLLARIAFPKDELKTVVQKGSKKPEQVLRAYNLCDGKTSISEIAKLAKLAQPSLSIAVDKWEAQGIILKIPSKNEVFPLRLFEIA
jgi:DNA-binding MarR family transcriptional regulator